MGRGSTRIRLDDDRFKLDLLKTYCPRNEVPGSDIIWEDYVRQVKLSLSVIKHYAMETDKIMEVRLHTFITSALPLLRGRLYESQRQCGLCRQEFLFQNSNPDLSVFHPVAQASKW